MSQTFSDHCYFCPEKAQYNQVVLVEKDSYTVSGVCKNHLIMGLSS